MAIADTKQTVLAAAQWRSAIRKYDVNKPMTKEDMAYILEVGRLSPSSIGLEPWRFLVIENPAVKAAIKACGWGHVKQIETAAYFVIILAKKQVRYDSERVRQSLERRGLDSDLVNSSIQNYQNFQANDMDLLSSPRQLFDWSARQTYIALGNMMQAAAMIGIDSCPIEGFNYEQANQVLTDFNLIDPAEEGISVMVSFGYRLFDPRQAKSRRDFDEIVTFVN